MSINLKNELQRHFNFSAFRTGQEEIIADVLAHRDVLGVLPTGSGKSLCFQLPSLLLPHLTIVISPLISLMIDQVRETRAYHIKRVVALHSMLPPKEREEILTRLHEFNIVYISPELIQHERIIARLRERKVSLFVIDEAHCISQWGFDFRPDYLRLKDVIQLLGNPTVLALSGTVTDKIEQDIVKQLARPQMVVRKYPQERKNIALVVQQLQKGQTKRDV